MTVSELPSTPLEADVRAYVNASKKQMNTVFNFDTVNLGQVREDRSHMVHVTTKDLKASLSM
jgi:hypothetical protein